MLVEISHNGKKETLLVETKNLYTVSDLIKYIQTIKNTGNLCRIINGGKIISSSANLSSLDLTKSVKCHVSCTKICDLRNTSDVEVTPVTCKVSPPSYTKKPHVTEWNESMSLFSEIVEDMPWIPAINEDPTKYYEDLLERELTSDEKGKVWSPLALFGIEEIYNAVNILRKNGLDVLPGRLEGFVNPKSSLKEVIASICSAVEKPYSQVEEALRQSNYDAAKTIELLISNNDSSNS